MRVFTLSYRMQFFPQMVSMLQVKIEFRLKFFNLSWFSIFFVSYP